MVFIPDQGQGHKARINFVFFYLGDSNENTQYTFILKKSDKISLFCLLF